MKKMGDAGISGFTSAFYNCGDTVNKAVSSMLSTVSGAVLSNLPVTNGAMETVVQSLANIVDGKVPAIPDIDIGYDADHGSIPSRPTPERWGTR